MSQEGSKFGILRSSTLISPFSPVNQSIYSFLHICICIQNDSMNSLHIAMKAVRNFN